MRLLGLVENNLNEVETININPGSEMNDRIYTTQETWDSEKLGRAIAFINLAFEKGVINNGYFSLNDQIKIHNLATPGILYYPAIIVPFSRINSNGKKIDCVIIRNGHHRIWVSRVLGVIFESVVDDSLIIGSIGEFKPNLSNLNRIINEKSGGIIGTAENLLHRNRSIERGVHSLIKGIES